MTPRANPTETEKRLDRIEVAVAQLAQGLRIGSGWKPQANGQHELAEVIEAARGRIEGQLERRPHRAAEHRREKAVA
jgi:plasmid stabilization system protein ParE